VASQVLRNTAEEPKETRTMKRSRYSDEQIAYALRQADGGTPVADVCRQLGIS
jgi:transposase-like protein